MMEEWPAAFPFLRGLQRKNTPTIESAVAAAGSEELLAEQMKAFARAHDVRFVLVDTEECPEGEELVRRFLGGAEVQGRAGRFVVFEVSRQGNPSHQ
jgi:hypothetical protein